MELEYKSFKEYLEEARVSTLEYTEKKVKGQIDRVIVSLQGNESGKFTKLIKAYSELKTATEELELKQKALNEKIKDEALEYFDSRDEVLTRVVETVSASMTISKKTVVKTSKTDYQKVIDAITELVPELKDQIDKLIEANTKISETEKSPGLRVDLKESEVLEEGFKTYLKSLWSKIKSWTKSYDKKLNMVKEQINQLK